MSELPSFEVDGIKFECGYFTGRKALTMSYRLMRYVGPSLAALQPSEGNQPDLTKAVSAFFENCEESEFVSFADQIFQGMVLGGTPGKMWEGYFQGKPMLMYNVLIEAVKLQFSSFFEEWPNLIVAQQSQKKPEKATLED